MFAESDRNSEAISADRSSTFMCCTCTLHRLLHRLLIVVLWEGILMAQRPREEVGKKMSLSGHVCRIMEYKGKGRKVDVVVAEEVVEAPWWMVARQTDSRCNQNDFECKSKPRRRSKKSNSIDWLVVVLGEVSGTPGTTTHAGRTIGQANDRRGRRCPEEC